jgi:hypothetical protein
MDYGVIKFILRQINTAAYAQLEIIILPLAVPFKTIAIQTHAQIRLGIGNRYRKFRKLTVKHSAVKLPELFLNVCYICLHQLSITEHKGSE